MVNKVYRFIVDLLRTCDVVALTLDELTPQDTWTFQLISGNRDFIRFDQSDVRWRACVV